MNSEQLEEFLRRNDRAYMDILRRALEHEVKNRDNPHYLGWEWYDVQAYPARLVKLVVNGIARVNFKSNSATCYLLVSRDETERAIKALAN